MELVVKNIYDQPSFRDSLLDRVRSFVGLCASKAPPLSLSHNLQARIQRIADQFGCTWEEAESSFSRAYKKKHDVDVVIASESRPPASPLPPV